MHNTSLLCVNQSIKLNIHFEFVELGFSHPHPINKVINKPFIVLSPLKFYQTGSESIALINAVNSSKCLWNMVLKPWMNVLLLHWSINVQVRANHYSECSVKHSRNELFTQFPKLGACEERESTHVVRHVFNEWRKNVGINWGRKLFQWYTVLSECRATFMFK